MKRWLLGCAIACTACPSNGDDDETDSGPPPVEEVWDIELSELDEALLAVHPLGGDEGDLFAVGGRLDGTGSPALHRQTNGAWEALSPPSGWVGAAWWSWSASVDDVWVVGDFGQVARGPVDSLQMVQTNTSTFAVFYGVWGSGPNDVWIVGGAPRSPSGPEGILLRWNGQSLDRVDLTATASAAATVNLFKVWGTSSDDVMIVGTSGLAMTWDGERFVQTPTNTTAQITTVHGRGPFEKYAVGGLNQGIVMRWDGFTWFEIGEPFAPPLSGVFAADDGRLWVAGDGGYLAAYDGVEWSVVDTGLFSQFHAVYAGSTGAFGVGGILSLSSEPRLGFVGRFGPAPSE